MTRFTQPRRRALRRPTAFTLVELLVVIAIIGVLVALLLPAIQAAREAARRAQCQSQLHNLALAVLNYESSKSELPPSSSAGTFGNRVALYQGNQLSWIVQILPYMEQQQLFQQFDLKKDFAVYKTEDVSRVPTPERAQPSVLMCPSDSAQGRLYASTTGRTSPTGNRTFGKGNYAAFASAEHIECQRVASGAMINEPQPLERIEDGLSNTLMLSEVRTRDHASDQRGAWAIAWPGATILGGDVHATTSSTRICNQNPLPSYIPNPIWKDLFLPPNAPITGPADDLIECPEPDEAKLDGMPCWTRGDTTVAPRSLHPGGVIGANVDGSVRWVADEVDFMVYGSIICINEGLTIAE